jgi:hypothetical protein
MAQDESHKIQRPLPGKQNTLLRQNLEAPNPIESPVPERRGNLKNPDRQQFPVEGLVPDNRQPQKSSATQKPLNRGQIIRRDDDDVKDIYIGLQDHDEAIAYYFNNVIKPSTILNGNRIDIPLIYGSPERWKGVQKDGYFRDKEGKIQVPLIMFKRDSVDKRRDLGNKMDANNPHLYQTFEIKYSKRNQYDNFSVLQNRIPQREFHNVVIPDYVRLKYSFIIWTDYVAQNNKIVEAINYASDSYWGDPERFKFMARIDTFSNSVELAQGSNRTVKTTFGLDLQGYIIPDAMSTHLSSQPKKHFSKSTVAFGVEYTTNFNKGKTREQIREESGAQNIQQAGTGVGYTQIGINNQIG